MKTLQPNFESLRDSKIFDFDAASDSGPTIPDKLDLKVREDYQTFGPKLALIDRPDQSIEGGIDGLLAAADSLFWMISDDGQEEVINFQEGQAGTSNERLLIRYFCAYAIRMSADKFEKKWRDLNTRPVELTLPDRLASLAALLLGNGSWTPDAIENLIHVVSLFGHEVLEIPERIDKSHLGE